MKRISCAFLALLLVATAFVEIKIPARAAVSIVGSWHGVGQGDADFSAGTFVKLPLPEEYVGKNVSFTVNDDNYGVMNIGDDVVDMPIHVVAGVFYISDGSGGFDPEGLPYLENGDGEIYIADMGVVWAKDSSSQDDPTPPSGQKEGEPEQKSEPEQEVPKVDETQYTPVVVAIDKTEYKSENDEVVPNSTYNFSNYVTARGATAGINKIVEKKPGDKDIAIYSGKPITIDREFLENIHEKNINLTYFFMHEGHLYSVTVTSDVDATEVLANAPYEGPLYVGKMLGTTRLIR